VIVGALALFIVLSGFSGLKSYVSSSFIDKTEPNIRISAKKGKSFEFNPLLKSALLWEKNIIAYSKIIEERAFFKHKKKEQIAYIKGVDENFISISPMDSLVYTGKWIGVEKNTAVVGNGIANKLALGILNYGSPLTILVPKPGKNYITNPSKAFKKINTNVTGIFSISEQMDNKFVFTSLESSQELLGYSKNQITAIDIKCNETRQVIKSLKKKLGSEFNIASREELNSFYKILNTEKLVAYLIFTLVLVIALFNVIGSIIMMVIDKKENLKTLYKIGASIREIKRIFILQGFLMTLTGLCVGLILGCFLIWVQNKFHLFMIAPTIPYPIEFKWNNLFVVALTLSLLGYLASLVASIRISKTLLSN